MRIRDCPAAVSGNDRRQHALGAEWCLGSDVLHSPAGELLVIAIADPEAEKGEREALVPFVAAIVPEVDVTTGTLLLDPPEGLLD